jgi:hypothetical protein
MAATSPRQQDFVNLPYEAEGERKAIAHPLEAVIQSCNIVRDFMHIVQRDARRLRILIEQKVRKRGLRPFDLRGKHSLLANVGVEEELEIGESGGHAVQSTDSLVRFGEDSLKRGNIKGFRTGW